MMLVYLVWEEDSLYQTMCCSIPISSLQLLVQMMPWISDVWEQTHVPNRI